MVRAPPRRQRAVRRESAEKVRGHLTRSISARRSGAGCGRSCATSSSSGSPTASACFASTIRTRSRSSSGAGSSPTCRAAIPTRCFSPKPSAGRASCTGSRSSASASRIPISRGATRSRSSTDYFTELAATRDYFRPNLWPNTPDILHEYLQTGGRPAFMARAALAATLGASYGIYGPAFELAEGTAARSRQRGVPRLGEVRDAALGPRRRGLAARVSHALERDSPRQSGPAKRRTPDVPAHRQRPAHLLFQAQPRRHERDSRRREPRPAPCAKRFHRHAAR